MIRTPLTRTAAAVALTCALVAGTAAASFAADVPAPTASSSASTSDGHGTRCTRAAHAERRLDRALTRIQGDAQHKGSVAWLEARATEADQAGKTERASALRARADRRSNRVPELKAAQTRLEAAVAKHCATSTPTSTTTS